MAKQKLWFTVSFPVEVEQESNGLPIEVTAKDVAWDRLIDPNEPPECMVQSIQTEEQFIMASHVDCADTLLVESDEAYSAWLAASILAEQPNSTDAPQANAAGESIPA